jgi:hypothetical protein
MTHFECVSVAVSLVYSLVLAKLLGGLPSALRPEKRYWVHCRAVEGEHEGGTLNGGTAHP